MTNQVASEHLPASAARRGDQVGFRCVFMRGGTSRGAFFHDADLPADPRARERVILAVYGSPDVRQIDGIGGADPLTSKVAIVRRSTRPDADVEFTFGQVRISEAVVDFAGNCGNMASGIGPFAIDEGLVPAVEPETTVRIYLTNADSVITARVQVRDGLSRTEGDAEVPGVPGTGASIMIDFGDGASVLGRGLLPTGAAMDRLWTPSGELDASIVDAGNPVAFIRADTVGLTGTELPDDLGEAMLARLEEVRAAAAVRLGLTSSADEAARLTPAIPKLYVVAPPAAYTDLRGRLIDAAEIDLLGRGLSMQRPHRAYAGTVAVCTSAAAGIPGTIVADLLGGTPPAGPLRIGHPGGVMLVEGSVEMRDEGPVMTRAAIERTARRIMEGTVYVPSGVVDPEA
jgi:2-methylaconitate cis-trans-isomerase PrpF